MSHRLSGAVLVPRPLSFGLEGVDQGCHSPAWDTPGHHGWVKAVRRVGRLFWGMVMKPTPVLGTQRLIGPPEEVALFLGTAHIQAIGVLGGMTLLKRGGFTAKALQTSPHVQHFGMRLTIHRFHIVQGLILPTKQQTRLDGTFHILPSLLRFSCRQTHVMARTHHIVHRTGRNEVLGFVIHVRHNVFRRGCLSDCVHHVIQFFHHVFHCGSGVFHHLAYHRITVLRCPRWNGLLLLPHRGMGRFSLPIGTTRWRHIDRHRAEGCFHPLPPTTFYTLEPFVSLSVYSIHIRASRVPIGQIFPIHSWSSRVPIGQRSLFQTAPAFPGSSFKAWSPTST